MVNMTAFYLTTGFIIFKPRGVSKESWLENIVLSKECVNVKYYPSSKMPIVDIS